MRGSDGEWLDEQLAVGPVRIRLTIESTAEPFVSHNVVGELPGADDDAALDVAERAGGLVPVDRCTPRWFFTSRIDRLERDVFAAIVDSTAGVGVEAMRQG